jgi:predicted Rossmann fold flavoprotein
MYQTVIIGGGPAGLFAAIQAANSGGKVLLLEKNEQVGKRLLVSGGGMCNYTRTETIKAFLQAYGDHGNFLRKALYGFNNQHLMAFFEGRGNTPLIREDGKVFSGTEEASDLVTILIEACNRQGVTIRTERTVRVIEPTEYGFDVLCYGERYQTKTVVIASGGSSRKILGGGLDGCKLAESLGHSIVESRPALTPVIIDNWQMKDLAGLSFQDMTIRLLRDDKKVAEWRGDLLMTHAGVSGPVILNGSRWMREQDVLECNFIGRPYDQCMEQVKMALDSNKKRTVINNLNTLEVPKRLTVKLCEINGVDMQQQSANINKATIKKIAMMLSQYRMKIQELEGMDRAMVMAGGVDINEIDAKTMQSQKVPGLFFAGEVMDIDGDTGGYNIQAACSTGYLAGMSCAAYDKGEK